MLDRELPENLPPYQGKGKILRIKEGYNPNSSSLGSVVFSIPTAMLAVPVILAGAAAFIAYKFSGKSSEEADDADELAESPGENEDEE